MCYQALKHLELSAWLQARDYARYATAVRHADVQAFGGDIRNVMFHKEIGTNVLSGMVRREGAAGKEVRELA